MRTKSHSGDMRKATSDLQSGARAPVRWFRSGLLLNLLLATTAALPLLATSPTASWAAGDVDFDIPGGDLGSVLAQIGRVGAQPIAFPADLTRGHRVGPIVGRMSVEAAVGRVLSGTGLVASRGAGGALAIRSATGEPTGAARSAAGGDVAAIDITDTRGGDVGFGAGSTQSSARMDIPLRENPRSVVGVTQEVIRAQAQTSVLDTARNVSNVRIDDGAGQGNGQFNYTIRGFNQNQLLVNGQAAPGGFNVPVTDVERVDVIKGPTSDLTGQTFTGGAINAIMKAPTSEPIRRADVFLGSRFYRTLAFDLGGPIADLDGVTYRLNLSGNTANTTFGGNKDPHEGLISPVVRWQGTDTTATIGMRYIDQRNAPPPVTFLVGPNQHPYRIARETPIGNAAAGGSFRNFNPYGEIEHKLGSYDAASLGVIDVSVHNRTNYFATNSFTQTFLPGPTGRFTGGGIPLATLTGATNSITTRQLVSQSDLLLVQKFDAVKNTMRFGIDYLHQSSTVGSNLSRPSRAFPILFPSDDTPFASLAPKARRDVDLVRTRSSVENAGLTFQNKIDIFDKLHILGFVRNDWLSQTSSGVSYGRFRSSTQDVSQLSYNGGAVYDILPWVSVYGSVGTGFQLQTTILASGILAPPQTSDLSEVGFKFSFLDDAFKVTVDRFSNAYSNSAIYDFAINGYALGPGYRAEGYEVDLQGQLTNNLQLIGGYSYTDYSNVATPGAPAGAPISVVPSQPKEQANLFAIYSFLDGPLQGFSIGAGARGQTFSYTSYTPKYQASKVPGFVTFDAALGYRTDNFRVDLNIKNMLDRYYYGPGFAPFVPVGQGRTYTIRASLDF